MAISIAIVRYVPASRYTDWIQGHLIIFVTTYLFRWY
jgi:hypothetical protein